MKYNEFAKEVHVNAVEHGWWSDDRSVGEIIALCHSEVSEALEEYRAGRPHVWWECKLTARSDNLTNDEKCEGCTYMGTSPACLKGTAKPEGIAVELADCIIRCFDWFGRMGIDADEIMSDAKGGERWMSDLPIYVVDSFGDFTAHLHMDLSLAYKCHCNASGTYATALRMGLCCCEILDWAEREGVDMDAILKLKHEYNKTRPYKHGGKVI